MSVSPVCLGINFALQNLVIEPKGSENQMKKVVLVQLDQTASDDVVQETAIYENFY